MPTGLVNKKNKLNVLEPDLLLGHHSVSPPDPSSLGRQSMANLPEHVWQPSSVHVRVTAATGHEP